MRLKLAALLVLSMSLFAMSGDRPQGALEQSVTRHAVFAAYSMQPLNMGDKCLGANGTFISSMGACALDTGTVAAANFSLVPVRSTPTIMRLRCEVINTVTGINDADDEFYWTVEYVTATNGVWSVEITGAQVGVGGFFGPSVLGTQHIWTGPWKPETLSGPGWLQVKGFFNGGGGWSSGNFICQVDYVD